MKNTGSNYLTEKMEKVKQKPTEGNTTCDKIQHISVTLSLLTKGYCREEEEASLIQNYVPIYTGKEDINSNFLQIYIFDK